MKKNRRQARDIGFYLLILVILLATILTTTSGQDTTPVIEYSEVVNLFENEQVESFDATDDSLVLTLNAEYDDSTTVTCELYSVDYFREDLGDLIKEQYERGIITDYDYSIPWTAPWWVSWLPYIGLLIIMIVFWVVMMNMAKKGAGDGRGAMHFGKARVRYGIDEKKRVTFADVAGCEEEKEELEEIVSFLKNPAIYSAMGARIPKGVLLVGPPGTGKTLLARAVAGEAGVQFLSISGSDFVELYVGVGASRVRDLFGQAKKIAPAIVFIDEIDAVGRQRGSGLGGGHDEREQTLNQILVEMDGFSNNEGVIVIAATNRADILDNALLRPGRFDRRVYVGLPDVRGREAILRVHSRGKPLGDDVDLASVARGTAGFSGADLENLMNEAALMAVTNKRRFIISTDIEEAIRKVGMGPEKKSRAVTERSRRLTAYHEAGHAVTGHFLKHVDPVHYITIIPRGPSGGATYFRPKEVEDFKSYNELYEEIVMALGGRISEKIFLDDISTGASNDIQQATHIARNMITVFGMSPKLGPISFDTSEHSIFIGRDFGQTKSYSEETAAIIDEEVKRIFDDAAALCEKILTEHKDIVKGLAEYLLVNESIEGEDFAYYCENGRFPDKPDNVSDKPDNEPGKPDTEPDKSAAAEPEKIDDTAAEEIKSDDVPDAAAPEKPDEKDGNSNE